MKNKHTGWGATEDSSQTAGPLTYPYAVCYIGDHQSPIDLAEGDNKSERLNRLRMQYNHDECSFYNSGHGVQVNTSLDYRGQLKIGNEAYPLIQFHFHEPSEHIVGGESFPV